MLTGSKALRSRSFNNLAMGLAISLVVAAAPTGLAHANTQLWLYPDNDGPRSGGHVLDTGSFTLVVENRGGGNGDSTAYDVSLVFAVNDPQLFDGGTLALPDGTTATLDAGSLELGTPILPCSEHDFPRHGVYPAWFITVGIGEIAEDETVAIGVDIGGSDGLEAHFDAYGIGYKQAGHTTKCYDVTNPPGHDVSVVLGTGGGGCYELDLRKTASATGVQIGDIVEYTISIANSGSCDLSDVRVIEDIPTVEGEDGPVPAFTVIEIEPPPTSQSPAEITWEIGVLESGQNLELRLTVIFDEDLADGHRIVNRVRASATEIQGMVCARAVVDVGEVHGDLGGPGYWCNQIRFTLAGAPQAQLSEEELEGWLDVTNSQSLVFSELWETATLDDVVALLCYPSHAESAADRLARHLLTLWFNLASDRVGADVALGDLCPGAVEPPPGMDPAMTVGEVIAGAEEDLVAGADDQILVQWAELIDFINNCSTPDNPACGRQRRHHGGRVHPRP